MVIYSQNIVTENGIIKGFLHIDQGVIKEISDTKYDGLSFYDFSDYIVAPGFIDIHIHGANGSDAMDASVEALENISSFIPKEGTTSYLATTMTQTDNNIKNALYSIKEYIHGFNTPGKAELLGIHLEGPFISTKHKGAQPESSIVEPSVNTFKEYETISDEFIKIVTLAPERDNAFSLIEYLDSKGIVASLGHSSATYNDVKESIKCGAKHITHFYNGMSPLNHREPGMVGSGLYLDDLMLELIVDGIHVSKEIVDMTYKIKNADRIMLITDAMRAKGLQPGIYDLGGQDVRVTEDRAVLLSNNSLAGSIIKMNIAARNMMHFTKCDLIDVFKMASLNQAKALNISNRKGSLQVGKDADVVVLNKDMNVLMTICRGVIAYNKI